MPVSGPLARGALRRPRSRPYLLIWALPASLHRLVPATQNLGGITGRGTDGAPDESSAPRAQAGAAGVGRPDTAGAAAPGSDPPGAAGQNSDWPAPRSGLGRPPLRLRVLGRAEEGRVADPVAGHPGHRR